MGKIKSDYFITGGFSILILLFLVMSIFGAYTTNKTNNLFKEIYEDSIIEWTESERAYSNLALIHRSMKDVILSRNIDEFESARRIVDKYNNAIYLNFKTIIEIDTNDGIIHEIVNQYGEWELTRNKVLDLVKNGNIEEANSISRTLGAAQVEDILAKMEQLINGEKKETEDSYEEFKRINENSFGKLIIGTLFMELLAIIIALYVRKKLLIFEKNIYKEKEELRVTIDSIGDGVIVTDINKKIVKINNVAKELTGWSIEEAYGKQFKEIFVINNELTGEVAKDPVDEVLITDKICELENHTVLTSKQGKYIYISDSAAPIKNIQGKTTGVVLTIRDVSEKKKKEKEILYITYHDKVTELYNRAYFEKKKTELDDEKYLPLSVIVGDINGLKLVNDAFGHSEGDKLLKETGKLLSSCCRTGIVARVGGDEFSILLPNTDKMVASKIMECLEKSINKYNDTKTSIDYYISIALGFSTKTESIESIDQVIKTAEDCMYKSKLLEQKSLHNSIIASIKSTMFEKSHETEEHGERLINYSRLIGKELNLQDNQLYELELLSTLHDIGKIGISDSILNKPGKLTEEEWGEMKKHPEIGHRIAMASPELRGIAEFILCHHERWDGKGYPRGLKGEEIPLNARIISIVDSYDAMTEDRVYSKAMTKLEALAEIEKNQGTQFDPEIGRLFVKKMS